MRRDLVLMGTIAAIAGIGLAAILTASLGVRSSDAPAPLKAVAASPTAAAEPPVIASSEAPGKRAPGKRARRHHRHHVHAAPAAQAAAPVVAQAAPVSTPPPTPAPAPVTPPPTRLVSAPAPAPAPKPAPKPPSRPKRSGGGGVSFDDSG